jgi:hypothetical protein
MWHKLQSIISITLVIFSSIPKCGLHFGTKYMICTCKFEYSKSYVVIFVWNHVEYIFHIVLFATFNLLNHTSKLVNCEPVGSTPTTHVVWMSSRCWQCGGMLFWWIMTNGEFRTTIGNVLVVYARNNYGSEPVHRSRSLVKISAQLPKTDGSSF